jgi:3-hydroxymyristoyl/3-hydroxydecanoyl-(acyl carrier protein) dehydratase
LRYLLIDRIDEVKKLAYAVGTKCVTLSEDVFEHHFPGQPVYPGALLIESMAQLGGVLLELSLPEVLGYRPRCVLSMVKAKFRDFVSPGDSLCLRAEIKSHHRDSAMLKVEASCGERRIAEADMLYIFLRVEDASLEAARADNVRVLTRSTRFVE